MASLIVDVVSAEEAIFAGEAKFVSLPGESGELGILPGHTPLISRIRPGTLKIVRPDNSEEVVFVAGGILEVQPGMVTVLADTAIRAADLDEAKAEAARQLFCGVNRRLRWEHRRCAVLKLCGHRTDECGWGVAGQTDRAHAIVFALKEPRDFPPGTELFVELEHRIWIGGTDGSELLRAEAKIRRQLQRRQSIGPWCWRSNGHGPNRNINSS